MCVAFSVAQGEFRNVLKDSDNPFFRSKYADLGSVMEMIRPVLAKNSLAVSQILEPNSDLAIIETVLLHTSGQWISSTICLKPKENTPQGMGSAITYARRYSLSALLGVASEVDDDGNTASGKVEEKKKFPPRVPNSSAPYKPTPIVPIDEKSFDIMGGDK